MGKKKIKKKKITFLKVYLVYLAVLAVLVTAAVLYVNSVIHQYEDTRPEKYVKEAVQLLNEEIAGGEFWTNHSIPAISVEKYEKQKNVQMEYLNLFSEEDLEYVQKIGEYAEDELVYEVKNGGIVLAEVTLKAAGEAVTKLAVFSIREWTIVDVKPVLKTYEYSVKVPADFRVSVNDVALSKEDGVEQEGNEITYTISPVYLEPDFTITNAEGVTVDYEIRNYQVMADYYHFALTLPNSLTVKVNSKEYQGTDAGNNHSAYVITLLEKPEIEISDAYGNCVTYEGGKALPLTYKNIKADSRLTVKVNGNDVPDEMVTISENTEYEPLFDYVDNLPEIKVYNIAVLEKDADISITDENNIPVIFDAEETEINLTECVNALEDVPDSVSEEIDILDIAQKWSLFMSNDLPFEQIKGFLIADSYQYKVARQYATGIDITFTSGHILGTPPFTDISVSNFSWITDDCFSVDVRFVKHMILNRTGGSVEDPMNDRFTFVKYDGTKDGVDNPEWKLVSMKEILSNE